MLRGKGKERGKGKGKGRVKRGRREGDVFGGILVNLQQSTSCNPL